MLDLDGTLLDSIDDIANSMNNILTAHGYPAQSTTQYKQFVGHGARKLLGRALPPDHGLSEETIGEMLEAFRGYYAHHNMDMTKPYDGIPELLRYMADAGIHLAVVSNKPQKSTEPLMKAFFADIEFVAVYGDLAGRPLKPDPYLAHELFKMTGVTPDQAVMIGDAEPDIIFAKNASVFSIGVLWGFRSREELEAAGPGAIVEHPDQIKALL